MRAAAVLTALGWSLSAGAPARAADFGTVTAAQACPAYVSIAKQTNPGQIHLAQGKAYRVVAHNKEPASWLQVVVDGASPKDRWVAASCAASGPGPAPGPAPAPGPQPAQGAATHLLALSWEPSFCEGHKTKAECRGETAQSADARRLSLHGLWPEPKGKYYCLADPTLKAEYAKLDSASHWDQLPEPQITTATRARLAAVMPGVQSLLERHEWIKHGTCFGGTPDAYFNRAADLVEQVNASAVGQLMSANLGKSVSVPQILKAFDTAFGAGASGAVQVSCQGGHGGSELVEIDVYLAGDVAGPSPLGKLLHAAPGTSTCQAGVLVTPKP